MNNASTVGPSPMPALADYPLDAFVAVLQTNLVAPLHLAQLVLPGMRARGSGVILNVSSDAGSEAYAGWGGYGTSKAALEHLSRVLAAELEGSGVRVDVVDPGDMNTQMHREAEPGVDLSGLPRAPRASRRPSSTCWRPRRPRMDDTRRSPSRRRDAEGYADDYSTRPPDWARPAV